MREGIKNKIVFIMNTNSFMNNIVSGTTVGLWTRFYAENLSLTWTQAQNVVWVATMFIMGHLTQNLNCRKWIFNHFLWFNIISTVIDLTSIIIFSLTGDARLLLLGDTLSVMTIYITECVYNEMFSANFSGNERGDVSARRTKWSTGGTLISMVGSMLIAILVVGDNKVPTDILLVSQILMWVVSVYTTARVCVQWKLSRISVYRMWRDQ